LAIPGHPETTVKRLPAKVNRRGGEDEGMIEYKCPACAAAMGSPASMAGKMETCPHCSAVCRVPVPEGLQAVSRTGRASPSTTARRIGVPTCQQCGGPMVRSRAGGGGCILQVILAIVLIIGVGLCFYSICLGSALVLVAIVLDIGYRSKPVWRCRLCRAVVPRG